MTETTEAANMLTDVLTKLNLQSILSISYKTSFISKFQVTCSITEYKTFDIHHGSIQNIKITCNNGISIRNSLYFLQCRYIKLGIPHTTDCVAIILASSIRSDTCIDSESGPVKSIPDIGGIIDTFQ